jgi:hypothetical protein
MHPAASSVAGQLTPEDPDHPPSVFQIGFEPIPFALATACIVVVTDSCSSGV